MTQLFILTPRSQCKILDSNPVDLSHPLEDSGFPNLCMDRRLPLEWVRPFQMIKSFFPGLSFPQLLSNHDLCKQCVRTQDNRKRWWERCNKYVRCRNSLMIFIWFSRRKYWDMINYDHFSTSPISLVMHICWQTSVDLANLFVDHQRNT